MRWTRLQWINVGGTRARRGCAASWGTTTPRQPTSGGRVDRTAPVHSTVVVEQTTVRGNEGRLLIWSDWLWSTGPRKTLQGEGRLIARGCRDSIKLCDGEEEEEEEEQGKETPPPQYCETEEKEEGDEKQTCHLEPSQYCEIEEEKEEKTCHFSAAGWRRRNRKRKKDHLHNTSG
ncbi:hypothetical protein E2C01_025697 [Portunus trituberculatus]|uniref:Uncharacterized protein n=1 Tax=Portunus trituberculatus TaxID=210409 RepID=A0A5B7EG52_PORTR|nr:hypothetical protein [Portunus trituberculatus]